MTDQQLLEAFESCTIKHHQWDHSNHIRVGYLYSRRLGLQESLDRMVSGINKLNSVLGIPELRRRGFHFTITFAWLLLVRTRMLHDGCPRDSLDFIARHQELMDKHLLKKYYSDTVLFSSRAKVRFVEPDLKPFPTSTMGFEQDSDQAMSLEEI